MTAVIERGAESRGIRLFQDSFNMQSLSLCASLGFEVRELAVVMNGAPKSGPRNAIDVRPLEEGDVEECERLCLTVHGFERTAELLDAIRAPVFSPFVAVRDGRITAYATTLAFFPAVYGVAESGDDLCPLIAGADTGRAAGLLPLADPAGRGLSVVLESRHASHGVLDADYAPTPVPRLLASLPSMIGARPSTQPGFFPLIVTTNYDDASERAFKDAGEEYDLVTYITHLKHQLQVLVFQRTSCSVSGSAAYSISS
jgi:hypothetical protein